MSSMSSGAVAAKAKAMYGRRLRANDYEELARKRSVSEIAAYLKNDTLFSPVLKDVHELTIHRGQLESLLHRNLFERMSKLYRYAGKAKEAFYTLNLVQVEIDEILSRIRMIHSGQSEASYAEMPLYLNRLSKLDLIGLLHADTYDELLQVCSKTIVYDILLKFRPKKGEQMNYAGCESAMQKRYYEYVFGIIAASFKGKEKRDLMNIYGTRVELENITKIYRFKKFFQSDPAVIRESLYPMQCRLSDKLLEELIGASDGEAVLKLLEKSPYHIYVDESDFVFIEYHGEKIKYHLAKRYIHYTTKASLVFSAYYVLADLEVKNLINIIEGVRYQLEPEEIEKMLIYE